jgi:tRNA (Thr-GGU) A37 N-methylase
MHPLPERDVLATRSPCWPNPIGITVAEILSVQGNRIRVTGLDALNCTPILDIMPYEEHFDSPGGVEKEREPGYRPSDTYH